MEKIYMEENNGQRQNNRGLLNFSIVLSFAVAVFAIFSIATYAVVRNQGMDAVSYAAPITTNQFNFNVAKKGSSTEGIFVRSMSTGGYYDIPIYVANNDINSPIFCVESHVDIGDDGTQYTKDGTINDYGLLYLLHNSYANGNSVTTASGDNAKYIEAWVTQAAIWDYLYQKNGATAETSKDYISPEHYSALQNTTGLMVMFTRMGSPTCDTFADATASSECLDYDEGGVNLYNKYVKPLVDDAKAASNRKYLTVKKEEGKEVTKTSDGKYFQTPEISVIGNANGDLQSYDVALSMDGAYIVDQDGERISPTEIPAGRTFFVRIPVEKVTQKKEVLSISVTGHFNTLTGDYFIAADGSDLQKVVTVTGATKDVLDGLDIEFLGAPDTGMNTAQTIYFIGLIVLLCGVGIVYANAKPVESKQQ